MVIDRLAWDSSFFGFEVGKVREIDHACSAEYVLEGMRKSGYRLCYLSTAEMHAELHREFVVSQVVLASRPCELKCVSDRPHPFILHSHAVTHPDESLVELALDAGWSSRFRLDPRVSDVQFRSMYETWIGRSCLREIADEVFIMSDGDRLVGFVTLSRREVICQIGLIAVCPAYRGRGVGRQLLSAAARYSVNAGAESLRVVTQENNLAALRMYESIGLERVEESYWYHFWCDDCE